MLPAKRSHSQLQLPSSGPGLPMSNLNPPHHPLLAIRTTNGKTHTSPRGLKGQRQGHPLTHVLLDQQSRIPVSFTEDTRNSPSPPPRTTTPSPPHSLRSPCALTAGTAMILTRPSFRQQRFRDTAHLLHDTAHLCSRENISRLSRRRRHSLTTTL